MKKLAKLEDLVLDGANANEGTLRGAQLLDASLEHYGAGRGSVVDANGQVIAGNKTVELSVQRGLHAKVVQTTGDELVVVQRVDLDLATDQKARQLAYMDNRASEVGLKWDQAQVARDLAAGLEFGMMFTLEELDELSGAADTVLSPLTIGFETEDQYRQWMELLAELTARYPHVDSEGQRVAQWAQAQMTLMEEPVA